ncbi:MAG: DUF1501 domain-containing protein [Planctomycetales bacterium]|nr:DUF1501 domain-containing protein [Planctomycetales bacterium]
MLNTSLVLPMSLSQRGEMTRRSLLQRSAAGLLASGVWSRIGLHADEVKREGKACILVWLAGAPSQMEMWDPKPGTGNGGETKAISTAVSGIQIAEYWPKIAKQMKEIALIRSVSGKEAAHERGSYHLQTGRRLTGSKDFPHFGAVVASRIGDRKSDMPNFVSVGETLGSGFLGVNHAPFIVDRPGELPENVASATSPPRLKRRLELLREQDEDLSEAGAKAIVEEHSKLYERANKLMTSPRLKSFELAGESEPTFEAYGKSAFGKGCLVARRLVESGVPFVEVVRGGWDMHNNIYDRIKTNAADVDQGLSQLLADLKQRGLLQKTLVICMGEFGRTPKINSRDPKPGRDHWAKNFNVLMAGCGVKGGRAIGKTNDTGQEITDRSVAVEDLFQSFCHCLEIDATENLYSPAGRPMKIVDGGEPIKELFA